jgi:hypothetical protein
MRPAKNRRIKQRGEGGTLCDVDYAVALRGWEQADGTHNLDDAN